MSTALDPSLTDAAGVEPVVESWPQRVGWAALNVLQATATVAWTTGLLPLALFLRPFGREVALNLARTLWARGMMFIGGVKLEITGLDNVAHTHAQVFVANHESMVDIPVAFRALPVPLRFMLKRELALFLPLGIFAWLTGMIFVNRKRPQAARRSLRRLISLGAHGGAILAFPEGTRSRGRGILPFKKGIFVAALQTGLPIVPVAIEGADRVLPSDGFRVRGGTIQVSIGPPIATKDLRIEDRERLTQEARAEVSRLWTDLRRRREAGLVARRS